MVQLANTLTGLVADRVIGQEEVVKMLLPTPMENTYIFAASTALATLDRQMGTDIGKRTHRVEGDQLRCQQIPSRYN